MYSVFDEKIKEILLPEQVRQNELLSRHTTFRIGGEADYFLTPKSAEEVQEILFLCKQEGIAYYVLGNGSNVLAEDNGYRGVIIHIGNGMEQIVMETSDEKKLRVKAGAGIMLSNLAKKVGQLGYTGFEFAAGIPGTLGGAIVMNAGAYGGEIKDCIISAKVMKKDGTIVVLKKEELQLGYRTSIVQKEEYIVLEGEFLFEEGNVQQITNRMNELNQQRREKQPLEYPSAGSTFKRPEGYFAGKLIQDAGLRGYRVGDIMVSEKHCGFVVNVGQGTARDAKQLMKDVSQKVYEQFQVKLEPEVRFLGE